MCVMYKEQSESKRPIGRNVPLKRDVIVILVIRGDVILMFHEILIESIEELGWVGVENDGERPCEYKKN